MKRGNIRTWHDYKYKGWRIQGRKNNVWVNVNDEDRAKLHNIHPELIFDLEYDACAYLQAFIEWKDDDHPQMPVARMNSVESAINKNDYLRDKKKKRQIARNRT